MNTTSNFHRIKLLAFRYLAENGRRDLVTLTLFFIAFAFLPRLIGNSSPLTSFFVFCAILCIGGVRFTARIFHEIHTPISGMHYLHIPASRLEKFLLNGALTLLFFPAICLLLYYGGTLFGNLLAPIMPAIFNYNTIDISSLIPLAQINKLISQYVVIHSVFFLGSLIFKKHPTSKTFISLIIISMIVGLFQLLLFKMVWADFTSSFTDNSLSLTLSLEDMFGSHMLPYAEWLLNGVIAVFLWVVAYFKFKEKQV